MTYKKDGLISLSKIFWDSSKLKLGSSFFILELEKSKLYRYTAVGLSISATDGHLDGSSLNMEQSCCGHLHMNFCEIMPFLLGAYLGTEWLRVLAFWLTCCTPSYGHLETPNWSTHDYSPLQIKSYWFYFSSKWHLVAIQIFVYSGKIAVKITFTILTILTCTVQWLHTYLSHCCATINHCPSPEHFLQT